ncbi:hypothetical protein [Sporosarcina sp. OR05]|uniref:hypothetical protein n=1 Tax=Sporosarcina sp. OR05 TaxID=2969819 RepID=UPI00352A294B
MKRLYKGVLIIVLLLISVSWGISKKMYVQSNVLTPEIIEYKTAPYVVENGWLCIPSGDNEINVEVHAKNTLEIYFYLVPTGTETTTQKVLIGRSKGKDDIFTLKHKFKNDESILYHFLIDAVGQKGQRATDILFNIIRCE